MVSWRHPSRADGINSRCRTARFFRREHLGHQVEWLGFAVDGEPGKAQPLAQHPSAPPEELLKEPLVR
jgi:D-alanyl-D-alanine carboxypeptidase